LTANELILMKIGTSDPRGNGRQRFPAGIEIPG